MSLFHRRVPHVSVLHVGLFRPEPPTTRASSQSTAEPNQRATQTLNPSAPPATQPTPPPRPAAQTRDPYAVHYGPEYRLIVDGKPFSKHS
jgi:hypothetical protein